MSPSLSRMNRTTSVASTRHCRCTFLSQRRCRPRDPSLPRLSNLPAASQPPGRSYLPRIRGYMSIDIDKTPTLTHRAGGKTINDVAAPASCADTLAYPDDAPIYSTTTKMGPGSMQAGVAAEKNSRSLRKSAGRSLKVAEEGRGSWLMLIGQSWPVVVVSMVFMRQ